MIRELNAAQSKKKVLRVVPSVYPPKLNIFGKEHFGKYYTIL